MRLAAVALCLMLTPLQAAAAQKTATPSSLLGGFANYNAATGPLPGSDGYLAQDTSNRLFSALAKVLGGNAPKLNFVSNVGSNEFDASASPATNTVNLDPVAMRALAYETSPFHSSAVNTMPHEFAHLRQTPDVLASTPDREGGAQAFADLVTPHAASLAGTHYVAGNFDGPYADYVTQAQAKGLAWLLGSQFGRSPVSWP